MGLSHCVPVRTAVFDERNLVSHAGLVAAMGLATRAGLIELTDHHLTVPGGAGHASTRNCGVSGTVVLRLDSAFYGPDVIADARRAGARLSITARKDRAAPAAISAIPEGGWTTIRCPQVVFDEELRQWISDAEVAEIVSLPIDSLA
jgi:hypothetical protein